MIVMNGKEVHPLRKAQTQIGDQIVHAWNTTHNRSWFVIDLALGDYKFVPAESTGMITADGLLIGSKSRRK